MWMATVAGAAMVATVLAWLRTRYAVMVVNGTSMEPVLVAGQRILVRKRIGYRVDDIVVFHNPVGGSRPDPPWLVKRVAAVAGDPLPADFRHRISGDRVPPGRLVVRGDAPSTQDSRHFGYVLTAEVLGVAIRALSSGQQPLHPGGFGRAEGGVSG